MPILLDACRICGCTDDDASCCADDFGTCWWDEDRPDVCTRCADGDHPADIAIAQSLSGLGPPPGAEPPYSPDDWLNLPPGSIGGPDLP